MKKILTLFAFLLISVAGISAQAEATHPLHRPGMGNQMRDLQTVLELDRDQMQIVKDYYSETSVTMRRELKTVEAPFERQAIKNRFQQLRDEKVRSILKEVQEPVFEAYLVERAEAAAGNTEGGLGGN